ncbi:phage tail spike protein, partial [Streptococcus pneumoniae]|uniref:phage tail spike protein n=2 Tax=Streptococcus pneumoniae TaxID=1313 RepID=UPI00186B3DF0
MIYLTEGNTPLNEAYNDEIVHLGNNTYQLTFRFPTSDPKWELLKEETFLTADDLHGEQDFYIFEVEKQQGYIQVYANQVISLLNNYIVSSIEVDRVSGTRVLSAFAGSITRANPFSFFSDIDDRHTLNIKDKNAMEVLAKGKHSILGQWGGDMVRNGYNLRLLKNGGSENESLFMYKKNLSSYQHKTSTKSLKTRITFKTTVKGEGENAVDHDYMVVIDSPLLGNYSQIYEDVVEVNDQDVTDEASLIEYGKQYFRTSMCDMLEDNLEISVVGQSDVAVQMFDVVSFYHEWYGLDVRKKITKYTYSPMAKLLKSIGFGTFQSSLANAIGGIVNDAVLNESRNLHQIFEERLKKEIANADRAFDAEFSKREKTITDAIELAKAKAEEVKQELSDTINQRFNSFDNGPLKEAKRKAEEALRNAGASSSLAQESKRIGLDSVARLEAFKSQTTSAQTALSGDLDALKRTIANDIRPKQAQAEAEIAKQVEALSRTKNELAGVKSAQATYEETTTRRLSELTNLANGKASKSELTQTAEELASRIASVQAGSSRNYFRNSRSRTFTTGGQAVYDYRTFIVPDFWKNSDRFKRDYVRISFDVTFPVALVNDMPAMVHFSAHPWYAYRNLIFKGGTVERQHFEFTIDLSSSSEDYQTNNVFIRFGTNYGFPAGLQVVIENAMLSVGNYFPAYQPAYEDQEDRVSVVESNFKQRADSLDAGVSRLTEGLRTKADISSLNVTAENIRQSVKSLETDTQNKLNQKLSQAEFEVRAGSIRQEILNATKNKASKSELTQTAEELSSKIASVQVGGRNYIRGTKRMMLARGLWASGTFRPSGAGTAKTIDVSDSPVTGFDKAIRLTSSNARDQIGIAQDGFYISQGTYTMSCWVKGRRGQKVKLQTYWQVHDNSGISPIFTLKDENWTKLSFTSARNRAGVASIGYVYLVNAEVGEYLDVLAPQLEDGSLATSSKEAPEDIEGHISTVESTFKQRANSLDAGVSRLTEGLRTKVDISALNVTAENIRQSVKSLETDTQNKLNQKLSQAEFEVRAGSIRQEILNATKDKASKSELTQTAEELASKIASVHLGRRNLLKGTKELARYKPVSEYNGFKVIRTVAGATRYQDSYVERTVIPTAGTEYIAIFYARASENDYPVRCHFYNLNTVVSSENSSGYKSRSSDGLSIIRLSTDWQLCWVKWSQTATDQAKTVIIGRHGPQVGGKEGVWVEICAPAIFEGNLAGDWSPAYEDQEDRVSAVESNFKQRADSLEAGVSRLTEGLRTKADISSLNVTAENIRQSVKSLETDTQNKLNQKLSQAEFEVRAGSIRQEILNVTKDKASKSELTQTAEELSSKIASVQVGGINLLRNTASLLIGDRSKGCWMSASGGNGRAISVEVLDPPKKMIKNMIRVIENTNGGNKDLTQLVRLRIGEKYTISCYARIASDSPNANVNLLFRSWANNTDLNRKFQKSISHKNWQKYSFTFTADAIENSIQFGQSGAGIIEICAPKIESGTLATDYSEAPEDIEGQISTVESTFKQRANSLDAGVSRLTEGLRTKVDISALNVTAENIRQSVKSLETDTQNKLNQKLSQAEFEVRA